MSYWNPFSFLGLLPGPIYGLAPADYFVDGGTYECSLGEASATCNAPVDGVRTASDSVLDAAHFPEMALLADLAPPPDYITVRVLSEAEVSPANGGCTVILPAFVACGPSFEEVASHDISGSSGSYLADGGGSSTGPVDTDGASEISRTGWLARGPLDLAYDENPDNLAQVLLLPFSAAAGIDWTVNGVYHTLNIHRSFTVRTWYLVEEEARNLMMIV